MSYKNYVGLLIGTYNERYEREFERIRLKRELVKPIKSYIKMDIFIITVSEELEMSGIIHRV